MSVLPGGRPLSRADQAGILCGGLDSKAGQQAPRGISGVAGVAAVGADDAEGRGVAAIRGAEPPPHRRGGGCVSISNLAIATLS